MANKFEDVIRVNIVRYNRERVKLPAKLGNIALNHFKDSFRKQGWNDRFLKRWKSRKTSFNAFNVSKKTDAGRAILIKTGRLRRDFDVNSSYMKVIIKNNTPYSVYHNYGTKRLPQRKFMGKSRTLDEKSGVQIMRMFKASFK